MTTTIAKPELLHFDPWATAPDPSPAMPRDWKAPGIWRQLPGPLRAIFGGVALEILNERPNAKRGDIEALAHSAWASARVMTFRLNGRERRVDAVMAETPAVGSVVALLGDVIRRLLDAGDVLATLRRERDRLDQQIAVLERLRGA